MAKFKVQDSKELENLIQSVPQKSTPRYTSAVAFPGQELGKYDQGITMYDTPESRRELNYQNQTFWQAWGNAVGQSLAEVTAGTLEGFGYLLDFEQHAKALYGAEKEFDNWFSESMRQFKDSVREEMPVFTDPNKPFDPLNNRWWASNLPSITSTLAMMVPTGAAVGAVGKLGKVGRILSSDAKLLGGLTSARAVTSGAISRVLESTMEAAGNADQVYKQLTEQGVDEETARLEAGKVASNTYYANLPLVLGDIFEYSVLFKNRGVDSAIEALNKQGKKSLLKSSLQVGGTMLSEGAEEGYQYVAGKEAEKSNNASDTITNIFKNGSEYFDDPEFLSSIVVGGISGGAFQALGNLIESRSSKLGEQIPDLNLPELTPIFQSIATKTGKSVNDIKVAATQAYQTFKGNLKEAIENTDEAVKGFPEGARETYKAGLEALSQINLKELGTEDVPTLTNDLWNGVKNKLAEGINRLKKLAGYNERIQNAEATGDKVQAEILSRTQFQELISSDPVKAESYIAQAQEEGLDTTDYEELLNTFKKSTVQHKGNQDAVIADTQAEIRRQTIAKLGKEVIEEGAKYRDFDQNQIREQYLNNIDSPEAKLLKSGIEIDKTKNKTVPKSLKNLIEHLAQLEIEEIKLTKQADRLDTKAGQEELAETKRQAQLEEIKNTTDPNVLFGEYTDEELSKALKSRVEKLLKSEVNRLPDPNLFTDYDEFKASLSPKDFPVLGSLKNTSKYDKSLIKYYNKHTRSNVKHVFEEENKILILKNLEGEKVLFKGKEYVVTKEGEKYILVSEYEIIEPDQDLSVRELGIVLLDKLPKKTYTVVVISELEVVVNNVKYLINNSFNGNVESLSPLNKPDQKITNEQMLVAVEIERNKREFKEVALDNYEDIVDTFDLKAIEEIYANGYTSTIDNALDKLYNDKKLNKKEESVIAKWLNNVENLLYKLLEYSENENVENAIKNIEIINLLLTNQKDKLYEKSEETSVDDLDSKTKEEVEKSIDALPRRRVYSQDIKESLTYKLNGQRELFTIEETEFEKTLPDTPIVTDDLIDQPSPLEIDSELPNYKDLNEEIAAIEPFGDFMLHSQLWDMASPTKQWEDRIFIKDQNGNNKRPSEGFTDWTDNPQLTEQFFNNIGDPKSHTFFFEAQNIEFKVRYGKKGEINKDNLPIRVYTIWNGQKVYVGQLQRTSQTKDKERTNTAALDELRQKAFEWFKTSKVGDKFTLGETKITNYNSGFFNVLAKPRPVLSALTEEERDNTGIGVYMGENEELGAMKTNRPDMVDIKPGKASPGSVFIAKKVPSGKWKWFGARTKKLADMPKLVNEIRDILQPFVQASIDGNKSNAYKYIARSEFIESTLARLRSIVRYKVDGKLEPDFNENIINVSIYKENGVFSIDKFITVNNLLDRPVQIDPKQLNDQNYVDSILNRLETDIDIIPFANPFFAVAPLDNVQLDQVEDTVESTEDVRPLDLTDSQDFQSSQEDIDFDIDIDDSPKFMLSTRDNSRKLNPEQAVKNLRKIIPNTYTVKVVEGLIKSGDIQAYGMVHDAAVTLSDIAPEGTEYHEAYHVIESILPEWQRKHIAQFGTEEERADAFMEYKATGQTKSELRKLFDNIIAFIKDLLKFNIDILELFERIDSGYYRNWKPTYLSKRFMLSGWSAKQKDDLVNLYVAHVGDQIDYSVKENVEGMINSDPAWNRMTSLAAKSPLHLFIAKVYKQAGIEKANEILQLIRKDAEIKIVDGKLKLTQGTPAFGVLYPELLKSLGKRGYKIVLGQLELRELHQTDSELEDLETNTLEGWQDSATLRSPMEKLSKRMKQLIYSIKSDKVDSIGLGMNLNYNGYEAYAKLASVIVDSIDVEDMKARLQARKETFFKNLVEYVNTKFADSENQWTELYKALGDKTQPEYWVLREKKNVDSDGFTSWVYKMMEANTNSIKSRIKQLTEGFEGTPVEFLELAGLEDIVLTEQELEDLGEKLKHQNAKQQVWSFLEKKVSSNFVNAHLNVEGKRQYEIINGGFFSKLLQRLQRDFSNTVKNLYSQDPVLSKLPILQKQGKPRDFKFIQFAGFKDHTGEGTMYNNYDERQFILSTFHAWKSQHIFAMPILSDSPNLVGVRYEVDKSLNMAREIAKLVHLEAKRSKNNFGVKNYKPEVRTIWGDIEYSEDLNKQELIVSKYFDELSDNYKTYSDSVRAKLPNNIKETKRYLMEHAFVHTQMAMISIGDLAFYKNLEDYYKRAKEIWSPVVKGNDENYYKDGEEKIEVISKRQRVKVLPSQEIPSDQIDDLRKIAGIPADAYEKVDKTDAQTYIDLIAYRDRMIALQEWTKRHQEAFVQLERGEIPSQDITGLFNVLKPFYYNLRTVRQDNEDGSTESLVVPTQKKDSELLILPVYGLETINGQPNLLYNPLWKQHLKEMGYNFDTMSYDMQGREEGKYYDVITYDTTIKVGKTDELYFNLSDWGKQQETPEHHYMSDAIFGTQLMKLITGNLEGSYNVNGESISAKVLWERYNQYVTEWISENYTKLIEKYGSLDKIKKLAIEDMINKGMRDDYIKSIEVLPITHPIHFNKIVQVINSFAKSTVTDLTFDSGFTFANASSEGFKKQPRIIWNNDDPNQGINHFQVYAPIHDKRLKKYIVNGVVDIKAVEAAIKAKEIPNLLEGLVYRIPTESKYSMFKIKIIGFLPVDNGVIFMPDIVTKIAGLDFDIDKVRGFFYGGNRSQDRILELMMAVLSSPTSLKEQLTPGGFDNLKDNNLLIRGYKAKIEETDDLIKTEAGKKKLTELLKDKFQFFSPITLSKIARRMNVGKALIGTAANTNAVHALMEAFTKFTGNQINDEFPVIYEGETLTSLSGKYDTEGNLISVNIAELLAAFVDNGKDPQAEYSNITSDTIAVGLYLLKKGVPLKATQFFLTQVTDQYATYDPELEAVLNLSELTESLKGQEFDLWNSIFALIRGKARKLEDFVGAVKVANQGAGATMVDNYIKLKKLKDNPYKEMLREVHDNLEGSGQTIVSREVQDVFKENSSIRKIGTVEEYSSYLDTIFPGSNYRKVVYHGSRNKNIEEFSSDFFGGSMSGGAKRLSYGKGFYFTTDKLDAKTYAEEDTDEGIVFVGKVYSAILNNPELDLLPNGQPFQIVTRKAEDIYILGSKKDIEGFKEFVSKNRKFQTLTTSLINKGLIEWNRYIVDKFGIPDIEKGTIGKAITMMTDRVTDRLSNDDIKNLYNSFFTYIGSDFFKYDQKLVDNLHERLNEYKLMYPDNKFLQRLKLTNGFIQFAGSNTNDELEIQSIIDNWTELLKSEDEKTKNFSNALVKYAFYTRGFDFGMGSFGHLIPLYYYEKNPEFTKLYTDRIKELDQGSESIAESFVEQYMMNNYYSVKLLDVEGKVEGNMLKVPADPATRAGYRAIYIRGQNGKIYKYAGEHTYQEIGTYARYGGEKIKYLQRYFYGAKPIQTQVVKTEKVFTPAIKPDVEITEPVNVVVPEGSNPNNLVIFKDGDVSYLMNDQQQAAYDKIRSFVIEKLNERSSDQSNLKVTKLGKGEIPKGIYENSIGLLGKGGTGKTTMLKTLITNLLEDYSKGYNRIDVRYIGPTHTATTMLQEALGFESEYTGMGVDTFASFTGRNQTKGSLLGIPDESKLWLLNDEEWLAGIEEGYIRPVSSADIIIIDESSMIDDKHLKDFIRRFKIEGGKKLPIFIFMGDYRQLPPIKEDKTKFEEGIISATVFTKSDKYVELTQVMRSKDKELHRVYDSVGQQITNQREQILAGREPDKFNWNTYDDATSKSTPNILVTQERQVDQVIEDYTDQLVKNNNPYQIFWTHYNNLDNQRTKVLFDKIRRVYFKKLGIEKLSNGLMTHDYVEYTQALSMPTKSFKHKDEWINAGEIKPRSRYKVKEYIKEVVPINEIEPVLGSYFPGVKVNIDTLILINRKEKVRGVRMFEKNSFIGGAYNKKTKTNLLTIRTSDGEVLTAEMSYKDYAQVKYLVKASRVDMNTMFEPSYIGSTHTVQGASIKTIIVGDYNIRQNQGSVDMRDIESSLYTALTRSAGKLVIIKPNVIPIENNQSVFSYTDVSLPETNQMVNQSVKTLQGQMTYSYGTNKRSDVVSTSTFEAIQKGERTATTRYESQGNIDYWKQANVGDVIEFSDGKENTVKVKVTKPLHKLQGSGKTAEQWSKLEGWSVDYFNSKVKPKLSEAWQLEYELANQFSQTDLDKLNDIVKSTGRSKVYTLEEINSKPEDVKQKIRECLLTGKI